MGRFRETLRHTSYDSKDKIIWLQRIIALIASIVSLIAFVFYYGFNHSLAEQQLLIKVIEGAFIAFVFHFFIKLANAESKQEFIKKNLLEFSVTCFLLIEKMYLLLTDGHMLKLIFNMLAIKNYLSIYVILLQGYVLILASKILIRWSTRLLLIKIRPIMILFSFYLVLIAVSCMILMMPEMTSIRGSMKFEDALFTAISIISLTGLKVVDTASYFSYRGHIAIMALIQISGIGMIVIASFFASFLKTKQDVTSKAAIQNLIYGNELFDVRNLIRKVLRFVFLFELLGGVMIYFAWPEDYFFRNMEEKIFYTVFHSISAFCNAGFSLFTDSLSGGQLNAIYFLQIAFILLVFFGGLGFPSMSNLLSIHKGKLRLSTASTIVLSVAIVLLGTISIYLLEYKTMFKDEHGLSGFMISLFQVANARTSGFYSTDIAQFSSPSLIIFAMIMFVGASSGSTGGGIKTSTLFVVLIATYANIRDRKNTDFRKQNISSDLIQRAFTIFIFSAIFILIVIVGLTITEPGHPIMVITIEAISAFSTTGFSMGLTESLSEAGRYIVMVAMYLGRVGPLTLAFALSAPIKSAIKYQYPKANIMVG